MLVGQPVCSHLLYSICFGLPKQNSADRVASTREIYFLTVLEARDQGVSRIVSSETLGSHVAALSLPLPSVHAVVWCLCLFVCPNLLFL